MHLRELDIQDEEHKHSYSADAERKYGYTYGAYLRIIASTLILRAARRYLSDSSRRLEDIDDMSGRGQCSAYVRSKLSPRHSKSSIFFVMIFWTSCKSSLSRSKCDPAAVSAVRESA